MPNSIWAAPVIKGMDVSTLVEVERQGGVFFENGERRDVLEIMRGKGINSLRLRLWNDPFDDAGHPYGGGTNDYAALVELARRGAAAGMSLCLDLHYSDFWADPGKQFVPKAWRGLAPDALEVKVYEFTRDTLLRLREDGIVPASVQVGNETAHGLLWPSGMYSGPEGEGTANMVRYLSAGCRAVREFAPDALIIQHFDNGGNNKECHEWFAAVTDGGVDFDLLALSYYPVFHGNFDKLEYNLRDLIATFGKPIVIAETSYGFCTKRPTGEAYRDEDYDASPAEYGGAAIIPNSSGCEAAIIPNSSHSDELPVFANAPQRGRTGEPKEFMFAEQSMAVSGIELTPEGQCEFLRRLFEIFARVGDEHIAGIYYWEPAWLPAPGSTWATKAGRAYVNDPGSGGNEWANQCLFDYDGNALPAWEVIRGWRS